MMFLRFADTNGDGTGTKNAAVNGSVTPVVFKIEPRGSERVLSLHRMIVSVVDSGSFDSGAYGNGLALSVGLEIAVYRSADDSVVLDLLDGNPIQKNIDWTWVCYDANVSNYGTGNESLNVRWTFTKAGAPVTVSRGEYLGITVNDDLTGLVDQRFFIQGIATE